MKLNNLIKLTLDDFETEEILNKEMSKDIILDCIETEIISDKLRLISSIEVILDIIRSQYDNTSVIIQTRKDIKLWILNFDNRAHNNKKVKQNTQELINKKINTFLTKIFKQNLKRNYNKTLYEIIQTIGTQEFHNLSNKKYRILLNHWKNSKTEKLQGQKIIGRNKTSNNIKTTWKCKNCQRLNPNSEGNCLKCNAPKPIGNNQKVGFKQLDQIGVFTGGGGGGPGGKNKAKQIIGGKVKNDKLIEYIEYIDEITININKNKWFKKRKNPITENDLKNINNLWIAYYAYTKKKNLKITTPLKLIAYVIKLVLHDRLPYSVLYASINDINSKITPGMLYNATNSLPAKSIIEKFNNFLNTELPKPMYVYRENHRKNQIIKLNIDTLINLIRDSEANQQDKNGAINDIEEYMENNNSNTKAKVGTAINSILSKYTSIKTLYNNKTKKERTITADFIKSII